MSSTTITGASTRISSAKVYEAVSRVLTSDEQSLRSIREATALELGVEPSTLTSPVARVLSKLVEEGSVERPRRGFYRSTQANVVKPKVKRKTTEAKAPRNSVSATSTDSSEPGVIGRKLEPKAFIPAPTKSVEEISTTASAVVAPEPDLVLPELIAEPPIEAETEPKLEIEPVVAPKVDALPELVEASDPVSGPEPIAVEPDGLVEPNPAQVQQVFEPATAQSSTQRRGLRSRIRSRRDRRWTPEGSMGIQGMVMIIFWFIAAGFAMFALDNTYGVLAAIGLAIVFWLLHMAMKPRSKRNRVNANSLPSRL